MENLETLKNNYFNAVYDIMTAIKEMLSPYGENGLELNSHIPLDLFKVTMEMNPNEFVEVRKVRVYNNELQVICEDYPQWGDVLSITDWTFFLDEVDSAIFAEENK